VARLHEKVNDLENKLKQKEHELEMVTSQVGEDVAAKTRSLQEELKKCKEQRRTTEDELVKVQRDRSSAHYEVKQDHDELNKQVQNAITYCRI
jgi:predicted  nucleic acid-binding Zn-ribbon protein